MSNTYVAKTDIKHGEADGSVVTFRRGEVVDGLDDDTMHDLYVNGALAVQGGDDDPNEEEVPETGASTTTPAMIQDSLERQAQLLDGPKGSESDDYKNVLTQPNEDPPEDPKALLTSGGTEEPAELPTSQVEAAESVQDDNE